MKIQNPGLSISLLAFTLTMAGCGGGGSSSDDGETDVQTGTFVDSPVSGLAYATSTRSGTTDANGEFQYLAGETVTFSIGDIEFPATAGKSTVTPLDVFGVTATDDARVVNLARLLQTLDSNNDPTDGISISEAAHAAATAVAIDFSSADFDKDPVVITLIASNGAVALVSEADAISHLAENLPYRQTDLAGTWHGAGIKTPQAGTSDPADFGYDVDRIVVDDVGDTIKTVISTSDGMAGETDTSTLTITERGAVSGAGTGSYMFMNAGKDLMWHVTLLSDGESSQELSIFTKKADSYALSDLAGTWKSAGIKTPQVGTNDPDDFGYDIDSVVIDGAGNGTRTVITTSDGVAGDTEPLSLTIDNDGWISKTADNYIYLSAGKDVIIQFNLLNDGESAEQLGVFLKQADSYSLADLEGTWYGGGIVTPQANTVASDGFAFDIDTIVFDAQGNATATVVATSDGEVGETGRFSVTLDSNGGFDTGSDDNYVFMNAGKDVLVHFVRNDEDSVQEFGVFVKQR